MVAVVQCIGWQTMGDVRPPFESGNAYVVAVGWADGDSACFIWTGVCRCDASKSGLAVRGYVIMKMACISSMVGLIVLNIIATRV